MQKTPSHFRKLLAEKQPKIPPVSLTIAEVRRHATQWLRAAESRDCSPRTIETQGIWIEKLIWFVVYTKHPDCGAIHSESYTKRMEESQNLRIGDDTLCEFGYYLVSSHKHPQGRWCAGDEKSRRPLLRNSIVTPKSYLRAFCRWLYRRNVVSRVWTEAWESPRQRTDQPIPFEPEHIAAMLAACAKTGAPARNRAIITLLFDTGLRRQEVANLTERDVDLDVGRIVIRGKGDKLRTVQFGETTRSALYDYLAERPELDYASLFVGYRGCTPGEPLRGQGIYRIVRLAASLANISAPGLRPSTHTVRHSYATNSLQLGMSQIELRERMGHSSLTQTDKYVKISEANLARRTPQFSPADNLLSGSRGKKRGRPRLR